MVDNIPLIPFSDESDEAANRWVLSHLRHVMEAQAFVSEFFRSLRLDSSYTVEEVDRAERYFNRQIEAHSTVVEVRVLDVDVPLLLAQALFSVSPDHSGPIDISEVTPPIEVVRGGDE